MYRPVWVKMGRGTVFGTGEEENNNNKIGSEGLVAPTMETRGKEGRQGTIAMVRY